MELLVLTFLTPTGNVTEMVYGYLFVARDIDATVNRKEIPHFTLGLGKNKYDECS